MASPSPIGDEKVVERHDVPADQEDIANLSIEGKDIAMAIVGEHRHAIDPAVEARIIRKVDLFLVPAMFIGYGLVYYDKVSSPPTITIQLLTTAGNSRICCPFRNDEGPLADDNPSHKSSLTRYLSSELGHLHVLFRNACWSISHDLCVTNV